MQDVGRKLSKKSPANRRDVGRKSSGEVNKVSCVRFGKLEGKKLDEVAGAIGIAAAKAIRAKRGTERCEIW